MVDKNHPACLELTLAASLIGAANAVVNFRLAPEELAYVVDDSRAVLAVVGAEFADTVAALRDTLPRLDTIVVLGGESDEYEQWLAAATPLADADRRPRPTTTASCSSTPRGRPAGRRAPCSPSAA